MKEDNISQLSDHDAPLNNNTRIDLVISLCSNSNHLKRPKLPQILDIYSVVALQDVSMTSSSLFWYCSRSKFEFPYLLSNQDEIWHRGQF